MVKILLDVNRRNILQCKLLRLQIGFKLVQVPQVRRDGIGGGMLFLLQILLKLSNIIRHFSHLPGRTVGTANHTKKIMVTMVAGDNEVTITEIA